MPKRGEKVRKLLHVFVFLVLAALLLFAFFTFMTVRTNINFLTGAIDVLKGVLSGSSAASLAGMQRSVSEIFRTVIIELIVLAGGIAASLFAINYLINIYYAAIKSSMIDELTGIYNRRALYKILDQEIKRAERFKHPLSIMMMDIDFFKVYNDNNGHVAGDVLLQRISKIIGSKIRDVDTLGRYGGEEFLVVLPETSHENAAKIGERIRKGVESANFKGEERQPKGQLTVSVGMVTFHGEYGHRTHLIHSADELLYKAKESGRNQLIKAYFKK